PTSQLLSILLKITESEFEGLNPYIEILPYRTFSIQGIESFIERSIRKLKSENALYIWRKAGKPKIKITYYGSSEGFRNDKAAVIWLNTVEEILGGLDKKSIDGFIYDYSSNSRDSTELAELALS